MVSTNSSVSGSFGQEAIDQGKQLFIQGGGQCAAGTDDRLSPIGKRISHTPGQQICQVLGPIAKGGKSLGGGRHQLRQPVIQSAQLTEQQPHEQPQGQSQYQQHPGDAQGGADPPAQGKPPLNQPNQRGQSRCGANAQEKWQHQGQGIFEPQQENARAQDKGQNSSIFRCKLHEFASKPTR